jgi:polyphosphate kinase 2 (PPK2 family)
MLELIDLDQSVSKETYQRVFPGMEIRLGECQRAARAAGVPVVIVFEGWDAAGKGTLINRLTQALDPRGFQVHPTGAPDKAERLRPWMWRFWTALPAAGSFAIFDRSWYGRVLLERIAGLTPKRQWKRAYEEIQQFERQLADDGTVIVKFWLHIGKREQRQRFKRLEDDPATAWKVGKDEWKRHRQYERWLEAVEEMLQRTSTAYAPWTVVEATHGRFARVKVFETVIQAVEQQLQRLGGSGNSSASEAEQEDAPSTGGPADQRDQRCASVPVGARCPAARGTPPVGWKGKPAAEPQPMPEPAELAASRQTILDRVDLSLSLPRDEYEQQLAQLQERLFRLEHELYVARLPAVIVYQGWDAAGKGGTIKRLTRGLDPRGYRVVPVGPPTAEEKAHHYLWRFWKNVPKAGHITIFDRSWYGRVMVERVEGLCTEDQWQRAFREINEFEHQLADFGTALVKFWLQIDRDEQLRRFQAREQTPYKRWKITAEDWRNREKWEQYEVAVVEMLERTSTTYAPWTILEANCKLYARIKALRTVAEALQSALRG